MKNKHYEMLVREETTYKCFPDGLSRGELTEVFERGDVKFREGREVDSNCSIISIEEIKE